MKIKNPAEEALTLKQSRRLREAVLGTLNRGGPLLDLLSAIIEAKFAPQCPEVQGRLISLCLAEVMDNPLTPACLYDAIKDGISAISIHGGPGETLRTGALVPGLIALAAKDQKEG